jgi:hypothetical protein
MARKLCTVSFPGFPRKADKRSGWDEVMNVVFLDFPKPLIRNAHEVDGPAQSTRRKRAHKD